ncbi:MAG: preprotein translocase subunit SecE [Steroidobacteraceae bacterium]
MTEQVQAPQRGGDVLKLIAAAVLAVLGFVAFYYLASWPAWSRWLLVLVGLVLGAVTAVQSTPGAQFWQFVQSSRIELRKVVWPTKDETWKLTGLVLIVVIILGLFFWGLDAILLALTRHLTGQGA